jgi:hypothetical protein
MSVAIKNPLAVHIEGVTNGVHVYTTTRGGRISDMLVRCVTTNGAAARTVTLTTATGDAVVIGTANPPVIGTIDRLGIAAGVDTKTEANANFVAGSTLTFLANGAGDTFTCVTVFWPAG